MSSPLESLFVAHNRKTLRASSYDRRGGNGDNIQIKPGQTGVLADIKGAGVIRHIWFTFPIEEPMIRRKLVLKMYWDDEENPSVNVPVGDFFGQGWGQNYNWISLPLAASPRNGTALNCYFPMPFAKSARIEILNESDKEMGAFYYYIDYELFPSDKDLYQTYGIAGEGNDRHLAYFHAFWNRELTSPAEESGGVENEWGSIGETAINPSDKSNYLFLEAEGFGHVVGVNLFIDSPTPMWYGEGDDMWLIDGEPWPGSLHGTGTEDFFNTSWCPDEVYMHPYFGYAHVPRVFGWMGRTHAYRFLLEDPIRFSKSIRGSLEHGHANVLTLDMSSVTYWYQTEPHKVMAPLQPVELRAKNMPEIGVVEVHRWRHFWREAMLKQRSEKGDATDAPLWGNERFDD